VRQLTGRSVLLRILAAALAGGILLPRLAYADGAWLDDPSVSWNTPGMAMVQATPHDPAIDPRCFNSSRMPETDEDQAVNQAGWTLFASYTGGWGIKVVRGLAGYDGMCRPMEYQAFVFVDGMLAGTLSPGTMGSRSDGALIGVDWSSPDQLVGTFVRYTEQDPLCCPSARSTVRYSIDRTSPAPVVVREHTMTEKTGAPMAP
jgi:LppP/LprE lipoprotein